MVLNIALDFFSHPADDEYQRFQHLHVMYYCGVCRSRWSSQNVTRCRHRWVIIYSFIHFICSKKRNTFYSSWMQDKSRTV